MPRSCTDINNDLIMANATLSMKVATRDYESAAIAVCEAIIADQETSKTVHQGLEQVAQSEVDIVNATITALNAEKVAAGC